MENQNNLSEKELEMIQKGKNIWDLDVLNKMDGGRVKSSTIKDLIGKVIENTWNQSKKFYNTNKIIDESDLSSQIEDIISSEVYLRDVPFSMQDGDMEKDPDSIKDASVEIIKLLKSKGLI